MKKQYVNELPSHWLNTAEVLHALGDTTRQRILLLFERGEELNIQAIADLFPYSRTNITHHIMVLEKAGILDRYKSGRNVFLKLNKHILLDALENVLTYIKTEV
jgi:DNA-binding transcriptional ArsR family regulator